MKKDFNSIHTHEGDMKQAIEHRQVEESLRQECQATLEERVTRYLQVKPHVVIAGTHFAPVSAEVALLFRDGHYYGCIALAQAVAEALVRFMCERNCFRPQDDFEKNVRTLAKRRFITEDIKTDCLRIWKKRNDFHHLNHKIEQDRQKLENLALEKAHILVGIERKVFSYTNVDGRFSPKYPKYWKRSGS